MKFVTLARAIGILFLCTLTYGSLSAQGVTTSSMSGKISDVNGEPLIGANITAIHNPSGSFYGTATDFEGNYRIPGMRVGGPYTITITYTGYAESAFEGVFLRLGEVYRKNYVIQEEAIELEGVVVTAQAGTTGQNAGASTQITAEDIDNLPTLDRDLDDFTRLTPQANTSGSGISIAGMNNRFNAIYIDGAVNNDVFGLANTGTNGGQTGISPISIDVIDQIQVVLSPYDVTLGGFAGGGINAVTKSGTNQIEGTAYYFVQNESLVGKTNGTLIERIGGDAEREAVADFSQKTYGASIGGPIVKDKIHFFVNAEVQDDQTPTAFNFGTYRGDTDQAGLNSLRDFVNNTYGYDPGQFLTATDELTGLKLFGKLDINLSQDQKLTIRHQYTKAENTNQNGSSSGTINYSNNGVFFPSTTNSFALELNSRFSDKISNNLILGYTSVLDDRDPIGQDFPRVVIQDGDGRIQFGSEEFSTANQLDQKIFTITDNLKLYQGNHTITIGTHNEFYDIYNLFIRQNFGSYDWDSVEDFINGVPAVEYDRSYSLVDDLTGDGSAAAADFNAMQLGFYAQDEIAVNPNLTVTAGIRVDIPIITDDPVIDPSFNTTTLPILQDAYEIANEVEGGVAPDGQLMFSPRVGFNYDIKGDRSSVLRGGAGIFTSRIPFVWPGAMFTNNGLTVGSVNEGSFGGAVDFIADPNKQLENPDFTIPSGQVDLFTQDFKYPQVFRANLAYDYRTTSGWEFGVEGIYTKTLNNILLTSINSDPTVDFTFTGTPDNRPRYVGSSLDPTYFAIYAVSNTNEGYTYNLTATAAKKFDNGLDIFAAYTYGDGQSVNEGTSSQNSSQWRGQINVNGRNNPLLGRSDFSLGHRVIASVNYRLKWSEDGLNATNFSLFFNGQSGQAFSYVIGDRAAQNFNNERGSSSRNRSLPWIPASQSEIVLVEADGLSPDQQWALLDAYIADDNGLSNARGGYGEKNGSRAPFEGTFDLAIRHDFGIKIGENVNRLQLSFDIFNLANLINNEWGTNYFIPGSFNNYEFIRFEGFDGTTPTYSFTDDRLGIDRFDVADFSSRWSARLGIRYIFN